eukprot:823993-Amphidinium_carterae.1
MGWLAQPALNRAVRRRRNGTLRRLREPLNYNQMRRIGSLVTTRTGQELMVVLSLGVWGPSYSAIGAGGNSSLGAGGCP